MADDEFIGRERECAQLASPIAEALRGHGSLILVAGEAGVGKTTLARQALSRSGLTVLEGFATPGGASAFAPLVEVLRAHLRSARDGPLVEGPLADHLALLLPELGPAAPQGDPAALFEAIRLALATIAAQQPTAIFLDDLQWADDATLELLPALARTLSEQPLLILAAYRSDELPRAHPIRRMRSELRRSGHLRQVSVEPFDAEGDCGTGGPDSGTSRTDSAPRRVRSDGWHSVVCNGTVSRPCCQWTPAVGGLRPGPFGWRGRSAA
jgi:AAA ATPase domain